MSEYAIETYGLTKAYGKKVVVDHVDMHIEKGSVYGFVGENGSGKTTIMRLLMDLALPKAGGYKINDIDFKDRKIYNERAHISAIVEAPSLIPTMTAEENLKFACLYYGVTDLSIIPEVLKKVGLHDTDKKKVKNFSLGMRQRMGIAVLLLNKPNIMLLDEPMNGLDPEGIAELRNLIIDLNKEGITFLISSHILSELEKVATHYGFISHGKLLKEINAEDLFNECQKGTDLFYEDLPALEEALKKAGIAKFSNIGGNKIRVFDEIKPLVLLSKLNDQGIEITNFKTVEGNVEEYYLSLLKEGKENA